MNPLFGKQTHTLSFKPRLSAGHHQQPTIVTTSLSQSAFITSTHYKLLNGKEQRAQWDGNIKFDCSRVNTVY